MSWWKKIISIVQPEKKIRLVTAIVPQDMMRKVLEKKANYIKWSKEVRDNNGFLPGCDSLLFTSLSVVGGYPANLSSAESNGRWYRRPSKDCYSSGDSKSSISRDMIVGLLWATYIERDVSRLHRFFTYSQSRGWVVGDGVLSRTIVTPQIQRLAADVLDKLGGGNHRFYRQLPSVYPAGLKGYESHIQLLQVLLRLYMDGSITKDMADRIHEHRNRNEFNCLAQLGYHLITDGDMTKPLDLLLGLSQLPDDRLPDSKCRSTEYLWEREHNASWYPAGEGEVYSGSDLIFAAGLIELFSKGR